jgi:hypothetical protein
VLPIADFLQCSAWNWQRLLPLCSEQNPSPTSMILVQLLAPHLTPPPCKRQKCDPTSGERAHSASAYRQHRCPACLRHTFRLAALGNGQSGDPWHLLFASSGKAAAAAADDEAAEEVVDAGVTLLIFLEACGEPVVGAAVVANTFRFFLFVVVAVLVVGVVGLLDPVLMSEVDSFAFFPT